MNTTISKSKQYSVDYTSVYVDTKGVFRWAISQTPNTNLNTVIESDADLAGILKEDKLPLIIDLTRVSSLDMNCENYFTNSFSQFFYAGVILVKSAVSILLADLILRRSNRDDIPIIMVRTEDEGAAYLNSIKALA